MTNSAISAAVIPSHDTNEEDLGFGFGFDDIDDYVTNASREQDSAALSRSLTTSQVDYVRIPGFLSRQHQQDSEGYPTSRTPLNSAAKWFKTRWPNRSRSVDSLERYPDPDTHRDRPPTPPSAPRSGETQMYHPPTREQQSEAPPKSSRPHSRPGRYTRPEGRGQQPPRKDPESRGQP